MYKAERAIIMAAGRGLRLSPYTDTIPKPLLPVCGKRMIDTLISALMKQGILEIYAVVGYQKEKFGRIAERYPNVRLIENPYYKSCNNISSLFVARNYLQNSIILDGDQVIHNPAILRPDFSRSSYCCTWTEQLTTEWLLDVRDGIVHSCRRNGGTHGWQLYSVSFWSSEDGALLKKHVSHLFEAGLHNDKYWDDIALFIYPDMYRLGIREIDFADITEIDDARDLIRADPTYGDETKWEYIKKEF